MEVIVANRETFKFVVVFEYQVADNQLFCISYSYILLRWFGYDTRKNAKI